ncbi:hypothetical protein TNCV_4432691 [Trichonephila clavipes]|nr:hypothetical protein TNCV_4432691 [Trichonephila clavipes]
MSHQKEGVSKRSTNEHLTCLRSGTRSVPLSHIESICCLVIERPGFRGSILVGGQGDVATMTALLTEIFQSKQRRDSSAIGRKGSADVQSVHRTYRGRLESAGERMSVHQSTSSKETNTSSPYNKSLRELL